jgi:NAD(P)-dependent dehydrogenase (short-subunit alcohol dehydrogenase family)
MDAEKKVVVVTGASQGIGAALVAAYRERGYGVVATARSLKPANDADILAVPGDIADRKTAQQAISAGVARFGRIDTLINNAGIFIAKPFTQADYAAVLAVNATGFFHITQLAIAEMENRNSGHIVQVATSLVDHANSKVPSVLASLTKGGLEAATKSLAIEYAKRGIRVNAVAPASSNRRCILRKPTWPSRRCIPSGAWARSPTSSRRSSTLNLRPSSRDRGSANASQRADVMSQSSTLRLTCSGTDLQYDRGRSPTRQE